LPGVALAGWKMGKVRYIYVVSRDHPWLYRHLLERFEGDRDVEVVQDRRVADRRSQPSAPPLPYERRKRERRRAIGPDDDLRVHSHYIVEL
jgi:hypothetical protein